MTAGLEFSLPVIAYNGVFLLEPGTGKRLLERKFTPEQEALLRGILSGAAEGSGENGGRAGDA